MVGRSILGCNHAAVVEVSELYATTASVSGSWSPRPHILLFFFNNDCPLNAFRSAVDELVAHKYYLMHVDCVAAITTE